MEALRQESYLMSVEVVDGVPQTRVLPSVSGGS